MQISIRWTDGRRCGPRAALHVLGVVLCALAGCSDEAAFDRTVDVEARKATTTATDAASHAANEARRPRQKSSRNLVIITLDTTRADALGVYGQSRPTSPAIDRMARGGAVFEQALASSPMTLPSHSTIFSGMHPYAHGVRSNAGYVLSNRNVTLAEVMRGSGYTTAAEVAVDVLRRETRIDQGFEHFRTPSSAGVELKQVTIEGSLEALTKPIRVGSEISAKGVQFLRANRDRPFFLWLHYFDAHQPYVISASHKRRIPDSRYHAAVAAQDEFVGRILDEIERLGIRDDTLVILTADHGEGLGEHEEKTHSYFVYDTTMRVPLIFWGPPEIKRGRTHASVVRTIDIAPTALDLLGLPALPGAEGVSLEPLLSGRASEMSLLGYGESFESASFFGLSPIRFVREGRWKYIHKVNPELFDVEADPGEVENLSAVHPEIVERLRARLVALIVAAPKTRNDSTTSLDAQTRAQLESLGYLTGGVNRSDFDEVASLEVFGEDPAEKVGDLAEITLAHALVDAELFEEALDALLPIVKAYPTNVYVLRLLAETYAERMQESEAIAIYQRVLEQEPCEEKTLSELNRLLRRRSEYDVLVDILGRGATTCPEYAGNLNNYAWALATLPREELRDGEAAVDAAKAALELLEERDPGFLDTLAAALAEAGRFDEAIAIQEEALTAVRKGGAPVELVAELQRHMDAYLDGRAIRVPATEI